MNIPIDRPFQNSLTLFLLVILLESAGILLFFANYQWGLLLTIIVIAALQALTLVLVWYVLKLSFHMGREIVSISSAIKTSEVNASKDTNEKKR